MCSNLNFSVEIVSINSGVSVGQLHCLPFRTVYQSVYVAVLNINERHNQPPVSLCTLVTLTFCVRSQITFGSKFLDDTQLVLN